MFSRDRIALIDVTAAGQLWGAIKALIAGFQRLENATIDSHELPKGI